MGRGAAPRPTRECRCRRRPRGARGWPPAWETPRCPAPARSGEITGEPDRAGDASHEGACGMGRGRAPSAPSGVAVGVAPTWKTWNSSSASKQPSPDVSISSNLRRSSASSAAPPAPSMLTPSSPSTCGDQVEIKRDQGRSRRARAVHLLPLEAKVELRVAVERGLLEELVEGDRGEERADDVEERRLRNQVEIRWRSGGDQVEIRWRSGGAQGIWGRVEIRWRSGGDQGRASPSWPPGPCRSASARTRRCR